jgi:hypothetical protein
VDSVARGLILHDPALAGDPNKLKRMVTQGVEGKVASQNCSRIQMKREAAARLRLAWRRDEPST